MNFESCVGSVYTIFAGRFLGKHIGRIIVLFVFVFSTSLFATQRNDFVFAQVIYNGNWNPYPTAWDEIYTLLTNTVNMTTQKIFVLFLCLNQTFCISFFMHGWRYGVITQSNRKTSINALPRRRRQYGLLMTLASYATLRLAAVSKHSLKK